jgi:hypothetical protein
VVRSEASTAGCAWGSARLKLDFVAILLAIEYSDQSTCGKTGVAVMFALVRSWARERCGERATPEALVEHAKAVSLHSHLT